MENCIFCEIVKGDIPSTTIYEDKYTLAFLDITPVSRGHTLVIPKKHHQDIFDIPEDKKQTRMALSSKLKELGFSVPYNAIPLNSVSELLKGISKLELGNVEEPILIIQGIDDDVVDRDSAIEIYDEVNSKEKKLLFLEDSSHQIISNEKDNYYSILNFITS